MQTESRVENLDTNLLLVAVDEFCRGCSGLGGGECSAGEIGLKLAAKPIVTTVMTRKANAIINILPIFSSPSKYIFS